MKSKYLMLCFLFSLMAFPVSASAISDNGNAQQGATVSQESTEPDAGSTGNQGADNKIAKCERVEAKIQTRLEKYGSEKEKHLSAYRNMIDRLDKFVENIKAKDYDTSALEADMVILEQKIAEFETLVSNSYAQMEQSQQYSCGQSQGMFVKSLNQSRQKLRLTHQKAQEIKTFYQTVIKPDLLELKEQQPGIVSNSTNTSSSDEEDTISNETN